MADFGTKASLALSTGQNAPDAILNMSTAGQYASLNLGDACGDDVAAVEKNRMLALEAVGAGKWSANLVNPKQVHGDHVVVVASADAREVSRAQQEAREGADAVVCTATGVPVLLCFADCVPVVLVAIVGYDLTHPTVGFFQGP